MMIERHRDARAGVVTDAASGRTGHPHSQRMLAPGVRRATIFCAILLLIINVRASGASEAALRLWLVFNLPAAEAAADQHALDAFFDSWSREGIDLYGLRPEASASGEFRNQLFGQAAILKELATFRKKHPAFPRIEVTFFTWDIYFNKIKDTSKALRPDLLQIPTTWCSSLSGGLGVLSPLPDALLSEATRQYTHQQLEPCLVYGERPLYGLPWLVDVRMLYFWRSALPSLEEEVRKNAQARDGFREALRSSQPAADYPLFALPTARDWELLHQTALLVWGNDAELIETHRWFNYHWSAAALAQPLLRGAEYIVGLARDRLVALPRETRQDLESKFLNHRLGSIISGPWLAQQLQARGISLENDVGMIVPPLYQGEPITFLGGSLLGVTSRSVQLMAPALDLAKYLSSGDGALPTAMAIGLLPASRDVRGTAAGAVRQQALQERGVCRTYYECLVAAGYPPSVPDKLEHVLGAARTYPPLPDWWKLEVQPRLGSMYYLWQDMAALQPRDSLAAGIDSVAAEWDESLQAGHRVVLRSVAGTLVAIPLLVLASVKSKRRRAVLMAQERQIQLQREQLREREQHVEASIAVLTRAAQHEGQRADELVETIDLLQQLLSEIRRQETPGPQGARDKVALADIVPNSGDGHFDIVLPSLAEGRLTILKNGRRLDASDGMTSRMIERIVRQSLFQQRRASFSVIIGALDAWPTPDELPKRVGQRWEQVVADMRKAFDSRLRPVVSRGKDNVYEFLLEESAYTCYINKSGVSDLPGRDIDFVKAVRDPFLKAQRLERDDPAGALELALEAFAAERTLLRKDVQVAMLVCRLDPLAAASLSVEQQRILRDAREELSRVLARYRLFFNSYASPEPLLQVDPHKVQAAGSELRAQWDELKSVLEELERVASGTTQAQYLPPIHVAKAWRLARHLAMTKRPEAARKDDRFIDAYQTLVEYWRQMNGATSRHIIELGKRLDPHERRRNRYVEWAEGSFPTELLGALTERTDVDESLLFTRLDTYLAQAFSKSVREGTPHILLEMAADGDPERIRDLRRALLATPSPADIEAYIDLLEGLRREREPESRSPEL